MNPIRNSAKAIIIQEGKLLCTKNADQFGVFYLLPGGGQQPGETISNALKRECLEEIAAAVKVGDLALVREYIGKNHQFSEWDSEFHQVEYWFCCELGSETEVRNGTAPDDAQIGVEWIDLSRLSQYRIYPEVLKSLVSPDGVINRERTYLGDVN
jgi:8-oxo-dGTP diphosphatase